MASTELLLQPLPADLLRGAGLHANGTSLPRGAHGAAHYSLLSVDYNPLPHPTTPTTPHHPSPRPHHALTTPYRP